MHRLSLNPSFGCGSGGQKQNRELNLSPLSSQKLCRLPQQQELSGLLQPLHMGEWKAGTYTNHSIGIGRDKGKHGNEGESEL